MGIKWERICEATSLFNTKGGHWVVDPAGKRKACSTFAGFSQEGAGLSSQALASGSQTVSVGILANSSLSFSFHACEMDGNSQ